MSAFLSNSGLGRWQCGNASYLLDTIGVSEISIDFSASSHFLFSEAQGTELKRLREREKLWEQLRMQYHLANKLPEPQKPQSQRDGFDMFLKFQHFRYVQMSFRLCYVLFEAARKCIWLRLYRRCCLVEVADPINQYQSKV